MALYFPNRAGFIESFKSVSLLEGVAAFDGLRKVELGLEITGAETVKTNKRKPQGHVAGDADIPGSVSLLYRAAMDYIAKNPHFLYEIHDIMFVCEEFPNYSKIAIDGLRFLGAPFTAEGTEAITMEIKFTALDIRVAVGDGPLVSLIPEASEQASAAQ